MNGKSGPERALLGTDVLGRLIVLATDGEWLANDCLEIGTHADDIGLTDKVFPPGLYLWEGTASMEDSAYLLDPPDWETVYRGTIRPIRPEEVAGLYAMTCGEDNHERG